MTDQRKEVINQLHELNILLLHTKLKATRTQTALRAATRVCNVEAARRGVPPLQQLPKSHDTATHMLDCLSTEDLSTLSDFCSASSTTPTPGFSMKRLSSDAKPSMNSLC